MLSRHGWLYGVSMVDAYGSCLGLVQPLSKSATSVCLDNFFFVDGTAVGCTLFQTSRIGSETKFKRSKTNMTNDKKAYLVGGGIGSLSALDIACGLIS